MFFKPLLPCALCFIALGGAALTPALGEAPSVPPAEATPAIEAPKKKAEPPFKESWVNGTEAVSPLGDRRFVGEYVSEEVRLTIRNLPPHARIRIAMDLLILKSWEGSNPDPPGPDVFEIQIEDGPRLVRASFSNFANDTRPQGRQSFPGEEGVDDVPAQTGAIAINALGYVSSTQGRQDAAYRLIKTFAHSASQITFIFTGSGLRSSIRDASWGLDRISVLLMEAAEGPVDERAIGNAWTLMQGSDAVKAAAAVSYLVDVGDPAVPILRKLLAQETPGAAVPDAGPVIQKLITELGDDDYAVRERATRDLKEFGDAAVQPLFAALRAAPSPEAKTRMETILAALRGAPVAAAMRPRRRLISALELMGGPESRKLLAEMAKAGGPLPVTLAAADALKRLETPPRPVPDAQSIAKAEAVLEQYDAIMTDMVRAVNRNDLNAALEEVLRAHRMLQENESKLPSEDYAKLRQETLDLENAILALMQQRAALQRGGNRGGFGQGGQGGRGGRGGGRGAGGAGGAPGQRGP